MMNIFEILDTMILACPVKCTVSIMKTGPGGDGITLQWHWKMRKKPKVRRVFISSTELSHPVGADFIINHVIELESKRGWA